MVKYSEQADELERMLKDDQVVWKGFWAEWFGKQQEPGFSEAFDATRTKQADRANRMLEILDEIGEPTISNIGRDAAQAVSILALHDKLPVLQRVLGLFEIGFARNKEDTYYQAIPSMADRVRILERKPQRFGTQWEFDSKDYPYLPTVEDFEAVDARRQAYGIEPLRWPKSLAISEEKQPWLKRPLSELVMRDIPDDEFDRKYRSYLA